MPRSEAQSCQARSLTLASGFSWRTDMSKGTAGGTKSFGTNDGDRCEAGIRLTQLRMKLSSE